MLEILKFLSAKTCGIYSYQRAINDGSDGKEGKKGKKSCGQSEVTIAKRNGGTEKGDQFQSGQYFPSNDYALDSSI